MTGSSYFLLVMDFWNRLFDPAVLLTAAPVLGALILWVHSRLAPTQRLSRAIQRNQSIWEKLPAGATRDRFEKLIDDDARRLATRQEDWRRDPWAEAGVVMLGFGFSGVVAGYVAYVLCTGTALRGALADPIVATIVGNAVGAVLALGVTLVVAGVLVVVVRVLTVVVIRYWNRLRHRGTARSRATTCSSTAGDT